MIKNKTKNSKFKILSIIVLIILALSLLIPSVVYATTVSGYIQIGLNTNGLLVAGVSPNSHFYLGLPKSAKAAVVDPGITSGQALVTDVPSSIPNMYDEGATGGLLGLGSVLDPALSSADIPTAMFWYPIAFLIALALGFLAYSKARSLIIQAAVSGVVMACFCGGGVLGSGLLPYWTVLVFVLEAILLILIQEKQNV
jgi:hypothetical protein